MRILGALCAAAVLAGAASAQVMAPVVESVPFLAGVDPQTLNLDQIKQYSSVKNFEILGHSYFKIDQRTPFAKAQGRPGTELGSGFNTIRVYDGTGYFAGYNLPPTLYHVVIADVRDPKDMKVLSTIPCNPGTRCNYLRVNKDKNILVLGHDTDARGNPNKVAEGEKAKAGWTFHDVSDPRNPKQIAYIPSTPGGSTHGLDDDGRYVYGCGQFDPKLKRQALQIIDYSEPANIRQVATWHVTGQMEGETFAPLERNGPDGKPQIIQCHEIVYYNDRLYIAWRDSGMVILDVSNRTQPKLLAQYDYVPPYHGGFLGAAHTSAPVVTQPGQHPDLVVHTDEIFECPPGGGRILDVSDLKNPEVVKGERPANVQLLSTFRVPVMDRFDRAKNEFSCPHNTGPQRAISASIHLPWFDRRSPSLVYVTWYDEGVRVMDISNPYAPEFIGHFLSPRFAAPGRIDRHTREIFQDPATNLLYVSDGNGGGVTVLRWTGPIPDKKPLPGAR
jgi:hypothetical protein